MIPFALVMIPAFVIGSFRILFGGAEYKVAEKNTSGKSVK